MYGCIGEHLSHSFSREIHEALGDIPYELREIAPEDVGAFLRERSFRGINVTIPYKQAVIPFLDEISPGARSIGAVNTIVNRAGRLYGYNTDADGLSRLIRRTGIAMEGKRVLILGTGGTARTAAYVAKALGSGRIEQVSRTGRNGALTYAAARTRTDTDVIIHCTPCGMYPHAEESPLSLDAFPALSGVVDVIYNPLRSRLVMQAAARGIPAAGGLYMLVAQAVRAAEIFRDTAFPPERTEALYTRILREKENVVLIGMPGSGKSAVGAALARRTGRPLADTDRWIEEKAGMSIPDLFRQAGEGGFRQWEARAVAELSARTGWIIATGGGTVLRKENVDALRRNGCLVWLDRDPAELQPTLDRPLADTQEKILRLYQQRTPLYRAAADCRLAVEGTPEDMAQAIESR